MDDPPAAASPRLARARFRAWHRGTREADYILGSFFDAYHASWDAAALDWFERLLDAEDPDMLAWAMGSAEPPAELRGSWMDALRRLDFVRI